MAGPALYGESDAAKPEGDLRGVTEELEQAYFSGSCSWPFIYGGVAYGERPIQILSHPTGLLQRLATPKPGRKLIRVYRQDRLLFRSQSYYPEGQVAHQSSPRQGANQGHDRPTDPSQHVGGFP